MVIKMSDSNFDRKELKNQGGVIFTDKNSVDYTKEIIVKIGQKVLDSSIKIGKEVLTGK